MSALHRLALFAVELFELMQVMRGGCLREVRFTGSTGDGQFSVAIPGMLNSEPTGIACIYSLIDCGEMIVSRLYTFQHLFTFILHYSQKKS